MSWKKVAFIEDVATLSDTPPVDVTVAAAAAGSATAASRQDHKHDIAVKLNELDAPDGAVALNSQKITGLAAGTVAGDAIALDVNLRAPDSTLLEGSSLATVQDHTPKAHTLDSHSEKKLDTLDEKTTDAGVTVDTCLIKDGKVADSLLLDGSNKTTVQDHTPKAHALDSHSVPAGSVDLNDQQIVKLRLESAAAYAGTPADGSIFFDTDDDHVYVYVAA